MRQSAYLNGCARGQTDAEIVVPDIDVFEELVDVGHEGRGLDQVVERGAGGFERVLQVLADLFDLRAHIAGADNVAVLVARQLAGNKHELFAGGNDDMGIEYVAADIALEQRIRLDFLDGHLGTVSLGYARTVEQARRATLAKGLAKSNPGKPHGGETATPLARDKLTRR